MSGTRLVQGISRFWHRTIEKKRGFDYAAQEVAVEQSGKGGIAENSGYAAF